MVSLGCFAHDCRAEPGLAGRMRLVGFPPCACRWQAGENIAYGEGRDSSPRRIVRAFLASPPHRKALLDRRYRLLGIGIARGTPRAPDPLGLGGGATYTTDFGFFRR